MSLTARLTAPLAGFLLLLPLAALAQEERPVELKPGPGLEAVEANCGTCHSLDYIIINSPFPSAKLWQAEVTKMIKTFGAPISEADARTVLDYLVRNYGQPG